MTGGLTMERLAAADVGDAAALCGRCVGKNLYPEEYLAEVIHKPGHYYSVLMTPEKRIAGYIYYYLTGLQEAAALAKLSPEQIPALPTGRSPVFGVLRSIGVDEAYRRNGLSVKLVEHYLEQLHGAGADVAFGVFWKPDGSVPMEKTLKRFGFSHLTDAHLIWYDNEDLVCPFCKGRCRCDAAIYYKIL